MGVRPADAVDLVGKGGRSVIHVVIIGDARLNILSLVDMGIHLEIPSGQSIQDFLPDSGSDAPGPDRRRNRRYSRGAWR